MNNPGSQKPSMKSLGQVGRKRIGLSRESVVKTGYLNPGQAIPFVVEPAVERVDLAAWARDNHGLIQDLLLEHRAVLFRGFTIRNANDFKNFVQASSNGDLLEYTDRSTPRHEVEGRIYVSTIYPSDQRISLHNEGTYWLAWPLKIYFCCIRPPARGGETPIADVRKVLNRIDPDVRERFRQKQVMYVRNYNDGFGLRWQEVFRTSDRAEAEAYCHKNFIEFEWKDGERMRTRQVRKAIREHPITGEPVWFNHGAFFHISAREHEVRKGLLDMFAEQDLPYMTYYGDASPIDPSHVKQITEAYDKEKVIFPWQQGDILLLDNMSVAHAREPYSGDREIIVAMAEPCSSND